jgi:hypothetical protein
VARLIRCPDCGAWVSRKASACPSCGRPLKRAARQYGCCSSILIVGSILFVVGLFVAPKNRGVQPVGFQNPVLPQIEKVFRPGDICIVGGSDDPGSVTWLVMNLQDVPAFEAAHAKLVARAAPGAGGDMTRLMDAKKINPIGNGYKAKVLDISPEYLRVEMIEGEDQIGITGWAHRQIVRKP